MVPVSMICPAKVKRSTIAAQSRGSVNVFVHEEKGSLEAIAIAERFLTLGEYLEQQLGSAGWWLWSRGLGRPRLSVALGRRPFLTH